MSLKDINELEQDKDEYVSTVKPKGVDYEEQPTVDDSKIWISRQQAKKAFKEHGFNLDAINYDRKISAQLAIHANVGAEQFFTKVDISKEPITQTIDVMHRQKAIEYYTDKDGREKQRVKEFLTYHVMLEGVDWLGNPVKAHLEYEGRCSEPKRVVHITTDEHGRKRGEYRMGGTRHKYYIPFTKKAVDDLLEKTGTDKNSVKWYGKFGLAPNTGLAFRNGDFSYDQFVNTPWEEFEAFGKRDGGPTGKVLWKTLEDGSKKYIGG